jgi:phage-related protein
MPANTRKTIGDDIRFVQWSWPVGKPRVDSFGDGLWEVRTSADGNSFRVIFCIHAGAMMLLHGFHKKTTRTPQRDLALARQRQKGLR